MTGNTAVLFVPYIIRMIRYEFTQSRRTIDVVFFPFFFLRLIFLKYSEFSFEIPWPRAIKCPTKHIFMKPVLENRKNNAAP